VGKSIPFIQKVQSRQMIAIKRRMVAWDLEVGQGNFWGDGNVLKLDCGDGCTILINLNSHNYAFKMGRF
jgi:hypothetical protein